MLVVCVSRFKNVMCMWCYLQLLKTIFTGLCSCIYIVISIPFISLCSFTFLIESCFSMQTFSFLSTGCLILSVAFCFVRCNGGIVYSMPCIG